jgi:hypothetical protein
MSWQGWAFHPEKRKAMSDRARQIAKEHERRQKLKEKKCPPRQPG